MGVHDTRGFAIVTSPLLRASKGLSSIVSNRRSQCLQRFTSNVSGNVWQSHHGSWENLTKSFIKMMINSAQLNRFRTCQMAIPKKGLSVADNHHSSMLIDELIQFHVFIY